MPSLLDRYLRSPKPPRISRGRAILAKCQDCCGNQAAEVERCEAYSCPLWIYRKRGEGKITQEQWEKK